MTPRCIPDASRSGRMSDSRRRPLPATRSSLECCGRLTTGRAGVSALGGPMSDGKVEFVRRPDAGGLLGEVLPLPRPQYEPISEPDWRKVAPPPRFEPRPPDPRAERRDRAHGPAVVRRSRDIRRAHPDTDAQSPRGERRHVPELPRERAVHADSDGAAHRAATSTSVTAVSVVDSSTGYPGRHRLHRRRCRHGRQDTRQLGVCHELLRQVPRGAAGRGERLRSVRPVAGSPRLRQVLRVPCGRAVLVPPEPRRRRHAHRRAKLRRLPLQRRHHRPGDRVGSGDPVTHARPPIPHVLLVVGRASAAHTAARLDGERPLPGRVRPGLGRAASRDPRAADPQQASCPRAPHWRRTPITSRSGTRSSDDAKQVYRPPDGGVRDPRRERRLRGRPPRRRDRCARRARQHPVHLHRGRQRRFFDRRAQRRLHRVVGAERRARRRLVPAEPTRRLRSTEGSYPNYSVGWAVAGSTPATWCIQMAHGGGNMAGTVVHWPKGIDVEGRHPSPVHERHRHRADDPRGRRHPRTEGRRRSSSRRPSQASSMVYSFDDVDAPERHTTQYNEVTGNRSIYADGWLAAVVHRAPWEHAARARQFRRRRLGALPHGRGLRPGEEPRRPSIPRSSRR